MRFSFVIDPSRRITYGLGQGNSITFPAGSLCDPSRSSYGDGQWDKPCVSATRDDGGDDPSSFSVSPNRPVSSALPVDNR